jgi:hypothetical protein
MKPLIETNPYLKNPSDRERLISRSVRTSCGVEGIKASDRIGHIDIPRIKDKKIYKNMKRNLLKKSSPY